MPPPLTPTSQAVPTEASEDGELARQLLEVLGPAHQAPDGTADAADFLGLGGALVDSRQVLKDALREAFAQTAWDTLDEQEAEAGLTVRPDLARPDREARLLAKRRAARGPQPQRILRAVRAIDPTATLVEHAITDAGYIHELDVGTTKGAARGVFVFDVVISTATWNDPARRAAVQAIVAQMQQAHTLGVVCTLVGFRCNDPNSRLGQTALI